MANERLLADANEVKRLATALDCLLSMRKFGKEGEPAGWNIAQGLADIEQSCRAIVDDHLPALLAEADNPGMCQEILMRIGEDLRHILYHTQDMRFYRYLLDR